jgi:hypothetical protein
MSFPFFDLLLDLQHCILEMCDPVSQYMFFCCSKASGSLWCPRYRTRRRCALLKKSCKQDSFKLVRQLLPDNHWITNICSKNTSCSFLWFLVKMGQSAFMKTRILLHLLGSAHFRTPVLCLIIRYGSQPYSHQAAVHLNLVIDELCFCKNNKPSNTNTLMLINSLVRNARSSSLERLLRNYNELPRSMVDSAMRQAASVSMVPEFSRILLPFYTY